jgi:hypothetical protein
MNNPVNMLKQDLMKIIPVALMAFFLTGPQSNAQFGNTYYHMFGIPQANQLNPAFQPGCDGYVAMPFLGPMRFEVESSSLSYGDIFEWDPATRKYITFMHPEGDKQKFMDALKPVNLVRAEFASNILSFGWRKEAFYFTVDLSERFVEGLAVPKDFAEFALNGNLYQNDFNFSELGQSARYFHEFALGASYNYEDEIQAGVRLKLLLGVASFTTGQSNINLQASGNEWEISTDITANASLPFVDKDVGADSILEIGIEAIEEYGIGALFLLPDDIAEVILSSSGVRTLTGLRNPGFAVDLGFVYRPIENLSLSASAIDLGFIRWKNDVFNFTQEMDYTFNGLELNLQGEETEVFDWLKDPDKYHPMESLLDSIIETVKIGMTQNPYTTMLTGKIYLGASYDLTEKVRFGGVFRTRIYDYKFYNQFTVSANVQPISMFSASLSYSIYGGSYMNLGLGLSMRAGPFNLYFVTDQAPSAYFWPKEFASMNFRLGMNIVWGCRAMSKAMRDRPLID